MMDQLPIRRCQYCGSDGLNLDWQHGEGIARQSSERIVSLCPWATYQYGK